MEILPDAIERDLKRYNDLTAWTGVTIVGGPDREGKIQWCMHAVGSVNGENLVDRLCAQANLTESRLDLALRSWFEDMYNRASLSLSCYAP